VELADRPKILCVDDEPRVLDGLSLQLGRNYQILTAPNGPIGLEILRNKGPFAVVVSDMRMPGMDGAAFLARVRAECPDAIRMLLTGYADVESAIAAVNEGQIFRFLAKPCAPELLKQAVAAGVEQYRLISAEKVLLEQTLRGCVKTLIDILSLTNPTAFGKATRIRDHVTTLATEMGISNLWQIEIAAMLSQLGTVVLPEATLDSHLRGQPLSTQEQAMVARIAPLNQELLANIPRLETIREWIAELSLPVLPPNTPVPKRWAEQCTELKILRIASDFDRLELEGLSTQSAFDVMRSRVGWYDDAILTMFAQLRQAKTQKHVRELPTTAVTAGMILVADVRTTNGLLVLARGHQFTPSSMARLHNYPKGTLKEPIRVTDK
jgi:CheY-like chemotaxis protein